MKVLIIVPTTMHNFSFSAPLAWLFSGHADKVKGIYGFQLTAEMVKSHDWFIIELNWFIELTEFKLIVEYIKQNNPAAKILFGGLYASLKYPEIFARCPVDYFIRGDNELPMQMILEGVEPGKIPNLTGKNFANPVTYHFKEEDYANLEFDLDWFPSYYQHIEKGQLYQLPMIITSKGGCSAAHNGCNYCMGSKHDELKKIYHRSPLIMGNDVLMKLLRKIEKKFTAASLMILSTYNYDFSQQHFDLDMNVEIDSPIPPGKVKEIFYAFKKCVLNIAVYKEGLSGESIIDNYREILDLEDDHHKVKFFAYKADAENLNIPADHRLYSEDVLPEWAYWDFYINIDHAEIFSDMFYSNLAPTRKFSLDNQ